MDESVSEGTTQRGMEVGVRKEFNQSKKLWHWVLVDVRLSIGVWSVSILESHYVSKSNGQIGAGTN